MSCEQLVMLKLTCILGELFGFFMSPRNVVYIAIRSDQKLTIFFAEQVRHMISNPSLSNINIMKNFSVKKFIGNMSYEILSFKKCT